MNRIIAIAAAALALTTATGVAAHAQDADAPSVKVSYADLDLSGASGRATLAQRISHAVDLVCGQTPSPIELGRMAAWSHCRSVARASADQQLAALYRGERFADLAVRIRPAQR